jgi:hypothetical protein
MVAKLLGIDMSVEVAISVGRLSSVASLGESLFLASTALDMMDLVTLVETTVALVSSEVFFCEAEWVVDTT